MSLLPSTRISALRRLTVFASVCLSLSCGRLYASTPTISITEYSVDGTNSGTARLSRNATLAATITGTKSNSVNWSVQGDGTITNAGVYSAPATMPSNGTVTVTATLASNSSVSASYSMQFIYNAPTAKWTTPSILLSGKTNSVEVGGQDFTPATTITVNGASVPAVFQSGAVVVQIPVAAGNTDTLSIVATNPAPGGGSSAAVSVPVKPIIVALSSHSTGGVNPTAISLGQSLQFVATVSGGDPSMTWPVSWSLTGGGTLTSNGLYMAPSVMPSKWGFDVTATLVANTSLSATYHVSLLDPRPVVNGSLPVETTPGTKATVTFNGENFVPGTIILVNSHPATTKYLSPNSITAVVSAPAGATGPLYITASNPAPHAGVSGQFLLPVAGAGAPATVQATVGSTLGRQIPGDFAGLSFEWGAQTFMGTAQTGVDNIFRQLIKNISNPGAPFFIRMGGGTTDISGEPDLSTTQAFSDLAKAMPVKFSLGVNLAANNLQLAEDQASWFSTHLPAGSLAAIELGNEPDRYPDIGARPTGYDFAAYLTDFAKWDAGIKPSLPSGVKIVGPALTTIWHLTQYLPALEQAESANVSIVASHMYGGYIQNNLAPNYLLSDHAVSYELSLIGPQATKSHSNGQLYRINEINSVDGGGISGMSNTFSSALWAADVMFATANVGADGVNFHGTNGCTYCTFNIGMQTENGTNTFRLQNVYPIYYGLLFFHDATQNSAKLLPVTVSSSSGANVKVWATQDAGGTVRVAILNKDQSFAGNVTVSLPGYGQATAIRLAAPNYLSQAGITIGGQTFDNSFDGNLIGSQMTESFTPTNSVYTVPVQPTSAVLLTLTK